MDWVLKSYSGIFHRLCINNCRLRPYVWPKGRGRYCQNTFHKDHNFHKDFQCCALFQLIFKDFLCFENKLSNPRKQYQSQRLCKPWVILLTILLLIAVNNLGKPWVILLTILLLIAVNKLGKPWVILLTILLLIAVNNLGKPWVIPVSYTHLTLPTMAVV